MNYSLSIYQIDKPLKNPYETRPGEKPYQLEIVWRNVLLFIMLHGMALAGFCIPAKSGTYWISEFENFWKLMIVFDFKVQLLSGR